MFKTLRRALCAHNFSWSERRGGKVCARCGQFQAEAQGEAGPMPPREP